MKLYEYIYEKLPVIHFSINQYQITGGTLLAGKICLDRGLACSTGGGTHHAFPDYGSGYCLINDLAVTAYRLIESGLVTKVMIVDLDVHQVKF